jgi:hypothetical protein
VEEPPQRFGHVEGDRPAHDKPHEFVVGQHHLTLFHAEEIRNAFAVVHRGHGRTTQVLVELLAIDSDPTANVRH